MKWSALRFVGSGGKPESIRTCEAKSLYYVGFKILVKSLKSTSSQRFLKGFRLIADGGEHLIRSGPGESVDQLGENMAEIASQTRRLIHGVC